LDVCGTELNPLGYNHAAFLKVISTKINRLQAIGSKDFDSALINSNLTSSEVAGSNFLDLLQRTLLPLAPSGLSTVTLTRGNSAVEKAV
jgi:hypothetical protein